jgi:hypothetical protein
MEEIDEFFRSCAVDPGVGTLLTVSNGYGGDQQDIHQFFNS